MPKPKRPVGPLLAAGPVRRTLFYRYGNIAFDPYFDFALEYYDAIDFAFGGACRESRQWTIDRRQEPLRICHDRLHTLVLNAGVESVVRVGELLSFIEKGRTTPQHAEEARIWQLHLDFNFRANRPPTKDEFWFFCWLHKHHKEIFSRITGINPASLPSSSVLSPAELAIAWSLVSKDELRTTLCHGTESDRRQLKRIIQSMQLPFLPGNVVRMVARVFETMLRQKSPVGKSRFIQLACKALEKRCRLSMLNLNEFVEYLASPTAKDRLFKWEQYQSLSRKVEDRLRMLKHDSVLINQALVTLSVIMQSDTLLEMELWAPVPVPDELRFDGVRRMIAEAVHLNQAPSFHSLICSLGDEDVQRASLKFQWSDAQRSTLLGLRDASLGAGIWGKPLTVDSLAKLLPGLSALELALREMYVGSFPALLWNDLVAGNLLPPLGDI